MKSSTLEILTPRDWKGYELLDSGNYEKLERFGKYIIARPEPQALWDKTRSEHEWKTMANAYFTRDKNNPEKGLWKIQNMPEKWVMNMEHKLLNVQFKLSLTSFKHVGLFPEQALNWLYIQQTLQKTPAPAQVLNLFAYTGGASVVGSLCGAQVTHVDSVKNVINWGNENAGLNGLTNIRWVVEDALKYVKREVNRGKKYQAIILDPPAYGRGPDGEKWVLEEHFSELLKNVIQLLDEQGFILISLYSMGLSPLIAQTMLAKLTNHEGSFSMGELAISDPGGFLLPLGTFLRYERNL